ncbi:hypothetical protein KTD13_22385 [Burkholderia multivorans]|uniref:hypothetical protein n=1 Tax=Burkholderia multivorans TaxID=87883 RepID=UPI0011B22869|nr:hypothetical protein [Burkholderia multivorans]MBU9263096.1 hypothetical protein [Burkholderia multivorans]
MSKEYDEPFALEIRIGIRISGVTGHASRSRKIRGNTLFQRRSRAACDVKRGEGSGFSSGNPVSGCRRNAMMQRPGVCLTDD